MHKTMGDSKKRVLLVDDDEEILEAVQLALEDRGYEVLIAHDGAEGLAKAERDEPDLIVLDLILPKRSGFMVMDHIRRGHVHSPRIIMLTAIDEQRHRDFAAACGVDSYIAKPFDMDKLLSEIDLLLQV